METIMIIGGCTIQEKADTNTNGTETKLDSLLREKGLWENAPPHEEPLKNECAHFLECVTKGLTSIADGREGLRVLKILKAAQSTLDDPCLGGSGGLKEGEAAERPYTAHETAVIDEGAVIGAGTKIWHFSHILGDTRIGENVNIGRNVVRNG